MTEDLAALLKQQDATNKIAIMVADYYSALIFLNIPEAVASMLALGYQNWILTIGEQRQEKEK